MIQRGIQLWGSVDAFMNQIDKINCMEKTERLKYAFQLKNIYNFSFYSNLIWDFICLFL